jgi:hypothetical protein
MEIFRVACVSLGQPVFHPKCELVTFRKIEALSIDPTCSGVTKKREIGWAFCRSTQVE